MGRWKAGLRPLAEGLLGFAALAAMLFLGETVDRVSGLPIPGAVLGLLFLFVALVVLGRVPPPVARAADFLLKHLNLFFVPAGVGILAFLPLIEREWGAMTVALVVSTFAGMAVAGFVFAIVDGRE